MAGPRVSSVRPGVALIGAGFIGPVHVDALRRLGIPVIGLLASSPERARPVADRLGIPLVFRDLDELLARDDVGAVHVASPNQAHFEQARAALLSDRHVVCEKPLAATSDQTLALVQAAAARPHLVAAVCHNIRFYPLCREMRERAVGGDLGRLVSVRGSYTQDWLANPRSHNWRVEPDGATNLRAVADIGTHWMDLAQYVTGRSIESVFARLRTAHPVRERPLSAATTFAGAEGRGATERIAVTTDDEADALLEFEGDLQGAFHVSQVHPGRKNRLLLEVIGTEGAMTWDSESPNDLWIGRTDRPNQALIRDPGLMSPAAAGRALFPGGHAEGFPDTFVGLFRAAYESVGLVDPTGEAADVPTFRDGHREVLICEAIARSAAERRWVAVEPEDSSGSRTARGELPAEGG